MAKKKIKDIVFEMLAEFMKNEGYSLYNVEFVKEGKDWFLRVYIDKAHGEDNYISTHDCEKVSRYLSEKLDDEDPIEQNYYLEVSSPGMDRELFTEEHFKEYEGRMVEVSLYKGIDGKKVIEGKLMGLENGNIVIEDQDEQTMKLPRETVAKIRLAVII